MSMEPNVPAGDRRIRLARPTDAAMVDELLDQLGYPQADTAATTARIRAWNDDSSSAAYVAESDGSLLGLVAVHICPFFEKPGHWGRITALVVAESGRGKGVGGELMATAESFAREHGCVKMEVTSSNHRDVAHEFYVNGGYVPQTERSTRFLRDLG